MLKVEFNWLPKGFKVLEQVDDFVHVQKQGKTVATYTQKVTEKILKRDIMKMANLSKSRDQQ